MKISFLLLISTLLTSSIFACGSRSAAGAGVEGVSTGSELSKPKPVCSQAKRAEMTLDKKITEYEKGVLYAYYCK